jgi:hypothetical protein
LNALSPEGGTIVDPRSPDTIRERERMGSGHPGGRVPIAKLEVSAYQVPTDAPESDGTYAWDKTTLVLVEVTAGGRRGLGYS